MGAIPASRGAIRFDMFEADLRAGELRKQGTKLKLQGQPFQVLRILLEHPAEVITREELRQQIWPADTFVDFEQGLYNAIKRLREALGDSTENPRFVETLARRGYRFVGKIRSDALEIRSLAVLPLENLSRDPDQDYFAEGMTEALITSVAKIGALRVVSRTTAMHYKGVHRPLPEIARELGVDGIVEGTVLRSGKRVRISAQLVHAPTDTHLWAQSYDRDLRDVLALQAEVAQAIAREVQIKLTPQERAHLAQVHPVDPEAYEAYLKGRYHWNRRSGEGFGAAVQCFQQAIAKDPTYAAAHAGLADCLSGLGFFGFVAPQDGFGRGKQLALQALEMDPSSAEAYASLAFATMFYDYDFVAAEREFERAIELNPRYATAHQRFGLFLGLMGRYEEGYTENKRAIRLDPHSSIIHTTLGMVYYFAHRFDQLIEHMQRTLELDPNFALAYSVLGSGYLQNSMHEPALAALRKGVELSHDAPLFLAMLGAAYARAGYRDETQKILERLNELSKQRYVTPYFVGRIYAALGQRDEVFRCLETAYAERAPWMAWLKTDPALNTLRSDPRFQDLLRRMNFPP